MTGDSASIVLDTARLRLRPFAAADAPAVQTYCAEVEIARTTLAIPHPYEAGLAAAWIAGHAERRGSGAGWIFAMTTRDDEALVGAIDLRIEAEHARAELGYVVYTPFWNRGYATEAARAIIRFGFDTLALNRIDAHHFVTNPASGRVLEKAGMSFEGVLRQRIRKWGEFIDVRQYAILRSDPAAAPTDPSPKDSAP
ncbi:MAG: GNAT family N-acetyltransferase [Phycisphaerales bacterium]|nr:GNAT family N-acetyltransferase [Phycisphaerales bacterium]